MARDRKLDKYKVLIVEDDPYVLQWIVDSLQMEGFEVHSSELSEHFFDYLTLNEFDVIVLDIMMDPINLFDATEAHGGFATGKLLAREIRDRNPVQKIVAHSSHRDAGIIEWFQCQEGMAFVPKRSEDDTVLIDVLLEMLDEKSSGGSLSGAEIFDALLLKPSIFGFGVDLKKVATLAKSTRNKKAT